MNVQIRRSDARGHADHGWLDSHHTFSFAGYFDPRFMGFSDLRVINEDRVTGGRGFGAHPHRDMEIVSYVLDGGLEHRDSMGSGSVIRPGDVQVMSAGTGVVHSEFNHSKTDPVHFLQIWILPDRAGHAPRYAEAHFAPETRRNQLRLVVSGDGAEGSLRINQDARIWASLLDGGNTLDVTLDPSRAGWLQVARGQIQLGDQILGPGDGAALTGLSELALGGADFDAPTEFLLFDLRPVDPA